MQAHGSSDMPVWGPALLVRRHQFNEAAVRRRIKKDPLRLSRRLCKKRKSALTVYRTCILRFASEASPEIAVGGLTESVCRIIAGLMKGTGKPSARGADELHKSHSRRRRLLRHGIFEEANSIPRDATRGSIPDASTAMTPRRSLFLKGLPRNFRTKIKGCVARYRFSIDSIGHHRFYLRIQIHAGNDNLVRAKLDCDPLHGGGQGCGGN